MKLKTLSARFVRHFLVVTILTGGVGLLFGCHDDNAESRAAWITHHISSKLDLNSAQKAKLDAVKQAFLDSQQSHKAVEDKNREQLKELLLAEKLDQGKAKTILAEHQKLTDQTFDAVFDKLADFHASLTLEQRKKAVEMLEKFSDH